MLGLFISCVLILALCLLLNRTATLYARKCPKFSRLYSPCRTILTLRFVISPFNSFWPFPYLEMYIYIGSCRAFVQSVKRDIWKVCVKFYPCRLIINSETIISVHISYLRTTIEFIVWIILDGQRFFFLRCTTRIVGYAICSDYFWDP